MTGQPPEGTERIYTGQYGDPFVEYEKGAHDPYGSYGEQRYREEPADYTLPGGPVSYDTTAYEFPAVPSEAPSGYDSQSTGPEQAYQPDPAYQPEQNYQPDPAYQPGPSTGPQPGAGPHPGARGQRHTGPHKMARPRPDGPPGQSSVLKSALSDFGFTSPATLTIVPILYKLAIAVSAIVALGIAVGGFMVNVILGVVALIILAPAIFVLGVGFSRLFMEFCLNTFRIAGSSQDTRNTTEGN